MDLFRLYYEIKNLFLIKEVQALFAASLPKAGAEISFSHTLSLRAFCSAEGVAISTRLACQRIYKLFGFVNEIALSLRSSQ
jgi:hypothetical protein